MTDKPRWYAALVDHGDGSADVKVTDCLDCLPPDTTAMQRFPGEPSTVDITTWLKSIGKRYLVVMIERD